MQYAAEHQLLTLISIRLRSAAWHRMQTTGSGRKAYFVRRRITLHLSSEITNPAVSIQFAWRSATALQGQSRPPREKPRHSPASPLFLTFYANLRSGA